MPSTNGAWRQYLIAAVVLTAAYVLTALIGLRWATVSGAVSPVFPAAGVALAGLLLGGIRLWPAIVVGRLLAFWIQGSPFPFWLELTISGGNALGAVVAAYGLTRWGRIDLGLTRLRDILWLTIWGAIAGSLVAATIGAGMVGLHRELGFYPSLLAWSNWWAGNVASTLVVAPLILAWVRGPSLPRHGGYWLHLAACLVTTAALSWLVFVSDVAALTRTWFVFPVLIWAAIAFQIRGAAAAMLVAGTFAVWGTTVGTGPLVAMEAYPALRFLLLQQFLAVAAVTAYVLAAVADERRAKEAMRLSEEHARRIIDNTLAFVGVMTPDGTLTEANATALRSGGVSREEVVGRKFWDCYWWSHDPAAQAQLHEAVATAAGGEAVRYDVVVRMAGDTRMPIDFMLSPVRDASGRVTHLIPSGIDITKRKRAEEQLRRNHDTFYHLIQNNPFGMYVVDADFRLRQVSLGAQKVFANVRPLLGRDFAEVLRTIWSEPFASQAIDRFRHTLITGEPYAAPTTVERRQDITEVEAYDWRIERISLPDGRFGIVCYFYDLSERQRWEAALRESEQKLRVALGAAELGTWSYTFDDARWELDERAQALYGTGAPVVRHDDDMIRKILHPADIPSMWEDVSRACDPSGHGQYHAEYRVRNPAGSFRWLRAWAQVTFEGDGPRRRAVRMIGSTRDITDSRDAEEALRNAKEEAERASAAKSDFLATLSHELRTPLTPVMLTVSLLENHPALPNDLREDVATIRRNVELESRLISDLLDLTRIERGKLQLDEQEVDLHLIIRSAIDICQREASAKLVVDLKARRHIVRGDSIRLQQIFWNLINNAQKFTPPDGWITVRSQDGPDGQIRVDVSDTGTGIDSAVMPKLFTAFHQGDTGSAKQRAGLGLGLAISKKLVEAHRGTISAASDGRGRGTTFTVQLDASTDVASHVARSRPTARPIIAGHRLNVLLVEDHEPTLMVMTKLLRRLGHHVTGATSVVSAAAAARQNAFDLIISDLGLPDGSGLDLIRQLKARYAGRAIALTGYGMESDIAATRAAGFTEHLTKPVDLVSLEAAIQRVAGKAAKSTAAGAGASQP